MPHRQVCDPEHERLADPAGGLHLGARVHVRPCRPGRRLQPDPGRRERRIRRTASAPTTRCSSTRRSDYQEAGGSASSRSTRTPAARPATRPRGAARTRSAGSARPTRSPEGPYLRVGTWRLIGRRSALDEGEEPEVTSISEPFTVSPVRRPTCDTSLSSDAVTAFKSAAQGRFGAYYVACAGDGRSTTAFKEINSQLHQPHSTGKKLLDKHQGSILKLGEKSMGPSEKDGARPPSTSAGPPERVGLHARPTRCLRTGEKKAIEILKKLTCTLGATYVDIAQGPAGPRLHGGGGADGASGALTLGDDGHGCACPQHRTTRSVSGSRC